jgi:FkbM family methyltransferase
MTHTFLRMAAWVADVMPLRVRRSLYRLGPISSALRDILNRAAPSGLTEVSIAAGPMKGFHLRLDLQSEKDLWLGNYEPELLALLQTVTPLGGVAFDIGANIGLISLALAEQVGPEGKVVAFEALPANVERLHANLALNDCGRRVIVEPSAVGAAPGNAIFLVHASGGMGKLGGSAGRDEEYQGQIEVPVVSLDDYVFKGGNPAPSLVKIDVEGGEAMVLDGSERLLSERHPTLLIELHGPDASARVWDQLQRKDYAVRKLESGLPQVDGPAELGWKAYVVAIPPRPEGERA